eukprot:11190642-Heterocapsa_arctica.AAC.1
MKACHSGQSGRKAFGHRRPVPGRDGDPLIALTAVQENRTHAVTFRQCRFAFDSQGESRFHSSRS